MIKTPLLIATSLLLGTVVAQTPLGTYNNVTTTYTSRGGAAGANTGAPTEVFTRIDASHYAGFGANPASPGMREIVGAQFVAQDQIGTTPETFTVLCYGEDPAAPNFPLVSAPLATVGPFATPASTATGAVAWIFSINYTTPVLAPAGQDVFLAVSFPQPATGTWPTDGMSMHATAAATEPAGFSYSSTPAEVGSYSGYHLPAVPTLAYSSPRQFNIDPIVNGAAGVAGTIHNIATAVPGNTPPGTSSMFAGLFPDAQNPPLNVGRVDDVAFRWVMANTPDNTPVFFLADFGTFGSEFPLSAFLTGSQGVTCLNLGTMATVGLNFTVGGSTFNVITIPSSARGIVAGMQFLQQAAALDLATNVAVANGCTRQIL